MREGTSVADAPELRILAAAYPDEERAKTILTMLQDMNSAETVQLADAAMIEKKADGKLHVTETAELTGRKGMRRGALILGTIGLIFPPSFIASVIVGGGIGALVGKVKDTGIKNQQMHDMAEKIEPGSFAVIALCEPEWTAKVEEAMKGYGGEVITTEFDAEVSEALHAAAMGEESA